jgi:hypothetical protein
MQIKAKINFLMHLNQAAAALTHDLKHARILARGTCEGKTH